MAFNGGKMEHIFKRTDGLYSEEFVSEEAKEALEKGIFYAKIDGSNHMVIVKEGIANLHFRQEPKSKKTSDGLPKDKKDMIRIPDGRNDARGYYYKDVLTEPEKIYKRYLPLLEKCKKRFTEDGFYSVELVNKKMTPGVTVEWGLAVHKDQILEDPIERTFNGMKDYLMTHILEGFVIEYKGLYWKVRADMYDKNCPFNLAKRHKKIEAMMVLPKILS